MLLGMTPEPRVRCLACRYVWNSAAMADGLRVLGKCPRCGGEVAFRDSGAAAVPASDDEPVGAVAPHRVLGLPRR
jgi:hypothetical protein